MPQSRLCKCDYKICGHVHAESPLRIMQSGYWGQHAMQCSPISCRNSSLILRRCWHTTDTTLSLENVLLFWLQTNGHTVSRRIAVSSWVSAEVLAIRKH